MYPFHYSDKFNWNVFNNDEFKIKLADLMPARRKFYFTIKTVIKL